MTFFTRKSTLAIFPEGAVAKVYVRHVREDRGQKLVYDT